MQFVNLQVLLLQFFFGGFWSHQLKGRYACLWVQLRQLLLVALADYPFCLFLPFGSCMLEHFMHYCQVVRAVFFPLGLALKEELHIHHSLHFSDWPLFISGPPLGDLKYLHLTAIFLNHQSMISMGNEGTNE